jgi:hypothetical protein
MGNVSWMAADRRGLVYLFQRGWAMWMVTQPLELANSSPGWLLQLDRATGRLLGDVDVIDGHGMAVLDTGELLVTQGSGVWWFRAVA